MQLRNTTAIIKGIFRRGEYSINVESNPSILEDIFRFRYKSYCLEEGFVNPTNCPNGLESDDFDKSSLHVVARNRDKEVVGYLRIIPSNKVITPTEREFNLSTLRTSNGNQFGEISRLIISKEFRKSLLFFDILSFSYHLSISIGIYFWIGAVEDWMIKNIRKYIGDIKIIGKEKKYFNTTNYPFIIELEVIPDRIMKSSRLLNLFFLQHKKAISKFNGTEILE